MKYLILSDTHIAPERVGGTTNQSRIALDDHLFGRLRYTIETVPHDCLIIVGDFFARYSAGDKAILDSYLTLRQENAIILRGNHDSLSHKLGHISSLELLGSLLDNTVLVFDKPELIHGMYFLPHVFDQDLFNKYVEEIPDNVVCFMHCNFANSFSEHADHSLNLSTDQYKKLKARGIELVLGHEHGRRELEQLHIVGCHWPTSISDCLSGSKQCLVYDSETKTFESIETWNAGADYIEMHWSEITETPHSFVRVVGECEVIEYPNVARSIARLRKTSNAFVVANAVKIIVKEREVVEREEITGFNILELLLENVDEEFREEIKVCI